VIKLPDTIYVATTPTNMHFSFDRLAGLAREQLGGDPRGEALFVFHNTTRTLVKLLWHDGRGYSLLYRRLDRGTYRIPTAIPSGASRVSVSARELALLLEGVDARMLREARRTSRSTR
jgi:transposase